ncbi:substrate-binding domain-containing protein [Oceanisphaera sp. KMM 10153]|uniref:substrate-binding domain-containing protein n=1 Tax=Oceanisphaera submarina TaxID=3390193 RepID=UPI003974DA54
MIDYRFAPNADVEKAIAADGLDFGLMSRLATRDEVHCQPVAEEPLLLVTPATVTAPSWPTLLQLGFIDHPDGAHHAGLLLGANYPEFQHSNLFEKKGFSNQINLILEPVSMGLGFTVLPAHAVAAFQKPQQVNGHRLSHPVSETLYLGVNRNRALPNRVHSVMAEARKWL